MKNDVNRALVAKKKFCKISLTLLAGLLLTFAFPSQGWASTTYYAKATATVASGGGGKVYAATTSTENVDVTDWNESSYPAKNNQKDNKNFTFFLNAKADDGYFFEGWSKEEGSSELVGTNSPYSFPVTSDATSDNKAASNPLYAKFSRITINIKDASDEIFTNLGKTEDKFVVFELNTNKATKADLKEPTFTTTQGGTWELKRWELNGQNVTVYYSYTPSETGVFNAVLTLTTKADQIGNANIHAVVEVVAENDAKRLDANGDAIVGSEGTLSDVLAAAQTGETVQLLRDVTGITSALTIDNSITLDLNAKTISGSVNGLLIINDADIEVVVKDGKTGGTISTESSLAGDLSVVKLNKGTLILQNVTLRANNTSTDNNNARTLAVDIASGAELIMNGGAIEADCASTKGSYGIYQRGTATVPGVFTMNGGTITASGQGTVRGAILYGTATINDGATITASGTESRGIMVGTSGGSGSLIVNGGVISGGVDGIQVNTAACSLVINNGSISGGTNAINIAKASTTGAVVKGGMFSGAIVHNNNKLLKGGYYTAQPAAAAIATNYMSYATLDGTSIKDAGYLYGVGGSEEGAIACRVINGSNNMFFSSLAAALDYANQNSNSTMTIIMVNNHTLPAGYYTLPAKATLLIPWDGAQTSAIGSTATRVASATASPFRKLTFATDAHLDAYGTIEVSGRQSYTMGSNGAVAGKYGQIILSEGSYLTMQNGSKLIAWGYITGAGEIDLRRGSTVYEDFQTTDYKGGDNTKGLISGTNKSTYKVFPMNQYYIQNIEVPSTYHPGSKCIGSCSVNLSIVGTQTADNIGIIGTSGCMFLMDDEDDSEDTWVRKEYDAQHDRQLYTISSSARLGSMTIVLSVSMNSADYVLPVTSNMSIHLLSGNMGISQSTVLLPGAEIEVDKESTVTVESGQSLYLYDVDEWDGYVYQGKYVRPVVYSPSWSTCPRATTLASLTDASINVHGTFDIQGKVYTTAGGANIYSSNSDAGTVKFSTAAPSSNGTVYMLKYTEAKKYTAISASSDPARLKNGTNDPQFATTLGTSAGKSYCYMNDKWTLLTDDGCFVYDNYGTYYAKPGDYVALKSNTEDANHLYYSDDETRTFILMEGCQWWEVEQTEEDDAVYYCADNDTYYYYDGSKWAVKTITVTWQNHDGSVVTTYNNVPFGGKPKYLGTNPTKTATSYYTYSFIGWLPEITDDTKLYENATYVAQYEQHEIRYTVTFKDENGKTIETQYVKVGDVPVCSFQPTKQGYYLYWKSDDVNQYPISAVSGNITYKAYYELIPKTTFTILFQNYNGDVLQSNANVEEGIKPAYTGETPTKLESKDKVYSFIGWTPDVVPATQDMTYVAKFAESPRLYTIIFQDINGVEIERHSLGYGEIPVCDNVPTKAPTAEFYYTVRWDSNIAAVTDDKTYSVADFDAHKNTLRLTVAAGANGSVGVQVGDEPQELSAIYDYGTVATVTATPDTHYQFKQWSDGNMDNPRSINLTQTTNITAEFELVKLTVHWMDEAGENEIASSLVEYGTTPVYTGATPNKPNTCGMYYIFQGWNPTPAVITADASYRATFKGVKNPSLIAYQLAFDGNGATSGSMPNQGFDAGVEQKIDANKFVNARTVTFNYNGNGQAVEQQSSSKTFLGWSDGTTTYSDGQMVKDLADDCDEVITLYAQWSDSYNQITLPTPTKFVLYRQFAGWYDAPSGGDRIGDAGDSYSPSSDITLYAQWNQQEATYTVEHYHESALGVKDLNPFRIDNDKQGLVGNQVSAEDVLKLEGYDSPAPSTQIIEASGTVVKYYYRSRNLNVASEVVIAGADLDQIVVENNGTLSASAPSTVERLVLTATPGNNDGANANLTNISISESVCIEIVMNSTGTMDDKLYYCFSVPFKVNVDDGVERLHKDNNTWSKAVLNTNYLVYTYSESDRAEKGPQDSNWTLFKGTQFAPGVFYLCAFDNSNYNRYRFYAADKTALNNKGDIDVSNTNTGDATNGGWNGVANNGLTDNQLSGDNIKFIQILNSKGNSFEAFDTNSKPLAIGNAAMVQVNATGSVLVGKTSSAVAARRMGEAASTEFINVRLYKENQDKHVDQIFIRASEDAAEQYVAGIDLSKATMGTPKVARLWVNDYDLQLVANEALMTNDQATFSLGMSAPANGEYIIALNEVPTDATIYLTENGSAIWNLNIAPAPISLSKGTENSYGLRLVRKINNVVTGFDEAVLNGNVQKVILNDHMYIIRDGKVYSAHGHVIK